jgi:hypothetical protein
MSLVDALREIGGGPAAGEFRAPRRARQLASLALGLVGALSLWSFLQGMARWRQTPLATEAALSLILPCFFASVAFVGWAVRMGRLRIDADGVRWGFARLGFRMRLGDLRVARLYRDAVALVPRRGFAWYLSGRDWESWPLVPAAFRRAAIPVEAHDRRAPFLARMQGYGLTLDVILVLDIVAAVLLP